MKVILAACLLLVAAVSADYDPYYKPSYKPSYSSYKEPEYHHPAHYKFDWAVKDEYYNDYGQYENRDGDKTTGNYWVVLPDGRKQIVDYYVDGYSGFVADVKYEGHAKYPEYKKPSYEPSYKPSYEPSYKPSYEPSYKPSYKPSYEPSYKPSYKPSYDPYKPSYKPSYY